MSSTTMKRALVSALFAISLAGIATAQETPTPAAQESPEALQLNAQEQEMQGWYTELQGLHQRLESIQEQALGDQQLALRQEELGTQIKLAMAAKDATMERQMSRMAALEAEAMAAQEASNVQKLQELMLEASGIQDHLMQLQQQVIEEPAIAQKLSLFQAALQEKMIQIEPQAQQLMDRFRELESKLTEAVGGGF